MKIFDHRKAGVSKKFLKVASAYRREVPYSDRIRYDWSSKAMKAQYDAESVGDSSKVEKNNGYFYGAHLYGITLEYIGKDISEGLFSKIELMDGATAHKRAAIRSMCPKVAYADLWYEKIWYRYNKIKK